MVTCPPPYSPAAMAPANEAYSSGWSSVGTASRLDPVVSGGPFGTAQLLSTPSRSSRRSQCTRSAAPRARPRGVWCSWTTNVSSFPAGSGCPVGGTGSAVRAGSRLARYSASGSARRPPGRAGTSGGAAGALGRLLLGGRGLLGRGGLLRRLLLGGRGLLRRGPLGRGRLLRRGLFRGRLVVGSGLDARLLRRGRLLRGGTGRCRVVVVRGAPAGALDAAAQRAHEVDDGGAGVGDLGDRLPVARALLGLERGGQRLAVVVGVLGRVEVTGHGGDQRLGHLQFLRPDGDLLVEEPEVGTADLVGPAHGVQHEDALAHTHGRERFPLPDGDLGDGHLAGVLQRVPQQHVRPDGRAVRLEVVGLLEVDGVDIVLVDELQHLDLAAGGQGKFLEVLVGEDDQLTVGQLVALRDVAVLDLFTVDRADPLVLHPAAVDDVDLVEPDVLVLGGRVELDADADEAEGNRPAPDRSHAAAFPNRLRTPSPIANPWPGQDRRIGAGGYPRQVDRRAASPGRRTHPGGEGTPGADRPFPQGDGRRSSFCAVALAAVAVPARAAPPAPPPRRSATDARESGPTRRRTAARRTRPPSSSSGPPGGWPGAQPH